MNWILIGGGLVVHLIFFYSIFDIYFTSPLVHGMTPHSSRLPAPAKRIVLFVADGLRADKLFELHNEGVTAAPFLRSKIENDGSWGVSHTRVPTESRPGHVALIAGFYEDVSAVAKGWKENPVEFDSVFNESRHTWSWGSPDILPMFSKGATGDHVAVHMYPGQSEDFAGADMTKLDTWVFDRVQEFFQTAVNNETLFKLLQEDKLVFFLHLLGLDTSGHVKKPHSREYQENLRVVDRGVESTMKLIEEFFQHDKRTSYLFTSDHGMTDWGSHGAGLPSETLTPLVCWGAGIRSPVESVDDTSSQLERNWQLSHIKRSDVNQADISALMSVLIGVAIPLQSVGQVPLDYLSSSIEFKAESIFLNTLQILEQFEIKMQQIQNTTLSILYTPFRRLMPSDQMNKVRTIRKLINERRYDEAINDSKHLIDLALEGLAYYHRYDRLFLGVSITAGFVGWMMYIVILLLRGHSNIATWHYGVNVTGDNKTLTFAFILAGIGITLFLYVQSLRWTYYIYTLLPVVLWHQVFQRVRVLGLFFQYVANQKRLAQAAVGFLLGLLGLELIILSFFYRELMSLGLISMAFWPLQESLRMARKSVTAGWSLSCILTSIFPLLPIVDRAASYHFVYLAGCGAALLALLISFRTDLLSRQRWKLSKSKALVLAQIVVLLASVYIVWNTVRSLDDKTGLPLFNQFLSWAISCSAFIIPLLSSVRMPERMLTIMLSLFAPYLLLSTSYESLFYLGLCVLMVFWISMEYIPQSTDGSQQLLQLDFGQPAQLDQAQRKLVSSDLRCAYFFIFFLLLAFFGTGNIASINTFDPTSVLCFVTVFNPFVMGALMLTKMLIPLLLVTCAFNAVHLAVNVPTQSLFLVVLLMSDFMALHFFFLVKDYGSWLEIGTSISHYVVVMAMISFLFVLLSISKILTNFSLRLPAIRGNKPHRQ